MTELPEPVQSTFALFETRRGNFLLALFIALEWYLFLVFGGMYMATTLQDKAVCAALGHVYKKANCIPERSVQVFKIIRPGALPSWVPLTVSFDRHSPMQHVRAGCWLLSWNRGGTVWLRPIFGGDVITIDSGGANAEIQAGKLEIMESPLIPLSSGSPMRLMSCGQTRRA